MNNGIIIFSGYNIRAVIAFCRYASENGLVLHVVAKDEKDPIFLTKYRSWVFSVRKKNQLEVGLFLELIQGVRNSYGYERVLVLPSTEYLNRFMLKHHKFLKTKRVIVPLVSEELYVAITNKYSFGCMCREYGLKTPEELSTVLNRFPFVAKPKNYSSITTRQLKPYLIHKADDLEFFKENENGEDYYFQEYISGRNFYLLYYISKQGEDVIYSQENLVQQSGGRSIICATASTVHNEPIAQQYLDMLKQKNFFGLIMIEITQCDAGYYMIEANPRMWGPLQLVVDAKIPLLSRFLIENEIPIIDKRTESKHEHNFSSYFWSGGIIKNQEFGKSIVFHCYTPESFMQDYSKFIKKDIFLRADTINLYYEEIHNTLIGINNPPIDKLLELYNKTSKHSNYQVLPYKLLKIIKPGCIQVNTRQEKERLEYIVRHLNIMDAKVLDIGGNTGFFTFELLGHGAKEVLYYEGNREHAEFVKEASTVLGYKSQVKVFNQYLTFDEDFSSKPVDIMLLLNVLHHIGDDYGDQHLTKDAALKTISKTIQKMAFHTKYLVFQLGYNWKGNRNLPLFEGGMKKELVEFVEKSAKGYWNIDHIGIPIKEVDGIRYADMDNINIERDDTLGEFLNRPFFIMSSCII